MKDGPSLEEKFNTAVEIVQNLPKDGKDLRDKFVYCLSGPVMVTNDEKLIFYGLYKQVKVKKSSK